MKLKILDLFSGLGGFSLGLERTGHFKTVAFCDNDKFSNLVLQKHWKGVKIYNDVKEITKERLEADGIESPDIITGGFPCQPFSVAGKQKGTSDDRHLWPEMFRIIKIFKSKFVIGENVRGIVNIQNGLVFETVCTDLESQGYEVQPFLIPAAGVGAPHRRERIFFIAIREESNVANTVSNDERQEISRSDEEKRGIQKEHRTENSTTRKFSRTSEIRKGDNGYESMENSNNNGLKGRLIETRNQVITGKESSVNGIKNTNLSSRRSDGGGDQSQPRINGAVQRLRNGNEKESTEAARVRRLHERTDIGQGVAREDRNYEDDCGALVSKRQSRIQSSEHRGLESNQTASENNQIRQRDDSASLNRMERGDENVENSRRTLQSRTELREKNEDETRKENANQHQRSGSPSESNVADTITRNAQTGRERQRKIRKGHQEEGVSDNATSSSKTSRTEDVADTERIGQSRSRKPIGSSDKETNRDGETSDVVNGSEREQGWWDIEPDVGRVAYGVSGRVHRLKGLGNSIVPQIAEEIGRAIIKAENETQ